MAGRAGECLPKKGGGDDLCEMRVLGGGGKDFTTKTGIDMKYEFVPWTSYADRFLNELNSKGKLCDLIIGDSQWIGGAAENGHYVKLNDFFQKEGITMNDFMPA